MYDLISMFGFNLFHIELPTLETLIRRVYSAITFRYEGKLVLKSLKDVKPAFTEEECEKVLELSMNLSKIVASKRASKPFRDDSDEDFNIDLTGAGPSKEVL